MPAPKFLAGLPKPLLFAVYGAVGGLLGALVFAEPLYRLLTPPPVTASPPPEPRLAIASSKEVELFVDGRNSFPVQIARADFDGPVTIRLEGLAPGVSSNPVTIPPGATTGEVQLAGAANARIGPAQPARVLADATTDGKVISADASIAVHVTDPPKPLADIVLVLDTSVKMQWALDELKDGIGKLTESLGKARIDYRLGLVRFLDRNDGGPKATVVQFKGGPFTADAAVFREEVSRIRVVIGSGIDVPQPSLEGLGEACRLPFRKDATKMLLLITDAPPRVVPEAGLPAAVQETANQIRDAKIDAAHLVTWEFDRRDYYAPILTAGAQPGQFFDLGRVVRGDEGFAALLNTLGTVVTAAAVAKNPESKPHVAATITDVPKLTVRSLQSGEQSAAGTEGRVVLRSGVWTGAIAALVCLFLVGGQHHYLRGKLPAAAGIAAGLLGGLAAGGLGGAAGQGLFFLAPDNDTLAKFFRVFGWALLGGLAGAGLSLFVPNMKWTLGLAGGSIGGGLGCLGFIAVAAASGDLVGRLVGGMALGFCIGLMVAVAEAAFRRAWLEVRYGERETISVTLGPEPVKVGSDARACTVWARGAPAVALRFFVRDGAVICDDVMTGRETPVGAGFAKEVGTLTVTVRTGAAGSVPALPAAMPRANPPALPERAATSAARSRADDDAFELPMPLAASVPARVQAAATEPTQRTEPRTGVPPAPPRHSPAIPVPVRPPAPPAGKPPAPSVPASSAKPSPPSIKPTGKNPDGCPGCGRVSTGKPGARYCMICDRTY
jgi:hypothetical protein